MNLTHKVANTLKSYVYLYVDPRNEEIFYIGKGKGKRYLDHLVDKSKTDKTKRIADIRLSGQEPRIDFLAYGLSDDKAILLEAVAINLIGKPKLTNKKVRNHQERLVRVNSEELIRKLNPEICDPRSMVNALSSGVYAINLDVLDNDYAYFSTYSRCFNKIENFTEIREPSLVNIKEFYDMLKELGYFSERSFLQHDLVIGNEKEYQRWLKRKGWGFVTTQYIQKYMSEWLNPRECFTSSEGVFIDIDLIPYLDNNSDNLANFHNKSLHGNLMQTRCKV